MGTVGTVGTVGTDECSSGCSGLGVYRCRFSQKNRQHALSLLLRAGLRTVRASRDILHICRGLLSYIPLSMATRLYARAMRLMLLQQPRPDARVPPHYPVLLMMCKPIGPAAPPSPLGAPRHWFGQRGCMHLISPSSPPTHVDAPPGLTLTVHAARASSSVDIRGSQGLAADMASIQVLGSRPGVLSWHRPRVLSWHGRWRARPDLASHASTWRARPCLTCHASTWRARPDLTVPCIHMEGQA